MHEETAHDTGHLRELLSAEMSAEENAEGEQPKMEQASVKSQKQTREEELAAQVATGENTEKLLRREADH